MTGFRDEPPRPAGLPLWPAGAPAGGISRTGPRRWWAGPLDVEGVALGSAEALAAALAARLPAARPPGERQPEAPRVGVDSAAVAASFNSFALMRVEGATRAGFAPLSGFHRTADGWVRVHANYPHHERALLAALGSARPEDALAEIARRDGEEVAEAVTAHGGLATVVRTPEAWRDSPPARALVGEPWIRLEGPAGAPGSWPIAGEHPVNGHPVNGHPVSERDLAAGPLPLRGVRVLDLTRVVAGPSASRVLGALGADVLRVDPPALPELWDMHADTGFDKRSAIADLGNAETRRRFRDLLTRADAILLGYRRGSLTRFGLDPQSLLEAHPHLAVVSVDAWGAAGPYANRRGFDSLVQAETGISHLYGSGEGASWRPGALPVQALDHATGLGMAAAVISLIAPRGRDDGARRGDAAGGAAHLSLARTAVELLAAGPVTARPAGPPLREVARREYASVYGALGVVPPPLFLDGSPLEYAAAPERPGSSGLSWLPRTGPTGPYSDRCAPGSSPTG